MLAFQHRMKMLIATARASEPFISMICVTQSFQRWLTGQVRYQHESKRKGKFYSNNAPLFIFLKLNDRVG